METKNRNAPCALRGGRAMCGYVIVGGEFCSLKPGEYNLQEGRNPKRRMACRQQQAD